MAIQRIIEQKKNEELLTVHEIEDNQWQDEHFIESLIEDHKRKGQLKQAYLITVEMYLQSSKKEKWKLKKRYLLEDYSLKVLKSAKKLTSSKTKLLEDVRFLLDEWNNGSEGCYAEKPHVLATEIGKLFCEIQRELGHHELANKVARRLSLPQAYQDRKK